MTIKQIKRFLKNQRENELQGYLKEMRFQQLKKDIEKKEYQDKAISNISDNILEDLIYLKNRNKIKNKLKKDLL